MVIYVFRTVLYAIWYHFMYLGQCFMQFNTTFCIWLHKFDNLKNQSYYEKLKD